MDSHPTRRSIATEDFPAPALQLESVGRELAASGQLGLLYVTALRRIETGDQQRWNTYDTMLEEIHAAVRDFHERRMRSSDSLVEPASRGNALVLLLDFSRSGESPEMTDVARVRARLQRHLTMHLARALPRDALERFGCYVGGTVMRHDPSVDPERIINRALEEAFADALRAQERESRWHHLLLRRVLRSGSLYSVYQPVVDISARRVIGYEALTRVHRGRFENPEALFRTAVRHDALWSLERLCRRRALEGISGLEPGTKLFLNTEPESIRDPELAAPAFVEQLRVAGLQPGQIVLEITEHSVVRDYAALRRRLEAFRSHGFQLAIDDVGAGHSGLRSVAEIAPDFLKVDMNLVRDVHAYPLKRELISTILKFSDRTGITLIAEGVESREELVSLAESGVRCAQGFLFARPGAPPPEPDWSPLQQDD